MMKKRGLRKTPALAAVVGAVLALTACPSGDNSGERGNGGAAETQTVTIPESVPAYQPEAVQPAVAVMPAGAPLVVMLGDPDFQPAPPPAAGWVYVSAGGGHTLAIDSNGAMWAWGANWGGDLGTGTRGIDTHENTPVQIGTRYRWAAVSAGGRRSAAIREDGSLWVWGGWQGQWVGGGHLHPVRAGTDYDWASVFAGVLLTMALKTDGSLWALERDSTTPVSVAEDYRWLSVVRVGSYTAGIREDGSLWIWGRKTVGVGDGDVLVLDYGNVPLRIGDGYDWVYLAGSGSHTMAIKADGSLWGWGWNEEGQIGDGTSLRTHGWHHQRDTPVRVGEDYDWSSVSAGNRYTVALRTDGSLWAWGLKELGWFDAGNTTVILMYGDTPIRIGNETDWLSVSAGTSYTVALREGGVLWAWGDNRWGHLGNGVPTVRTEPVQIGAGTDWASVSAGRVHSVAIGKDGSLWTWGDQGRGHITSQRSSPIRVGTETDWVSAVASSRRTVAVRRDGTLWAWGSTNYLPPGSIYSRSAVPIQIGTDTDWASVTAGDMHTIAIKKDGTLWGWGETGVAEARGVFSVQFLGRTPTQIGTDSDWVSARAGEAYTMALKTDGSLWGWGAGALGSTVAWDKDGPPVRVHGAADWVSVAAGSSHTLGVRADGSLWAWGNLYRFGFGGNRRDNRIIPTQVGTYTNWAFVASSRWRSIGIRTDGTLWAWGGSGREEEPSHIPVQIGDASDWVYASAGWEHAVAIRADGSMWAWGEASHGRLGDGSNVWEPEPVRVVP